MIPLIQATLAFLIVGTAVIAGAAVFVIACKLAKAGWQDDDGYHDGEPDADE